MFGCVSHNQYSSSDAISTVKKKDPQKKPINDKKNLTTMVEVQKLINESQELVPAKQ